MTTTNAPNAVRPELHRLALRAAGRTGADIERIVRELRGAARRNKRPIEWRDIEEALTNDGRPQRGPDLLWRMAVHEAGHAIAYLLHPGLGEVQTVSIAAAEGGETSVRLDTDALQTASGLGRMLICLLAGRAAERLVLGDAGISSGGRAESDLAHATRLALDTETALGLSDEQPLLYRPPSQPGDILHLHRELAARVHGRLEAAEAKALKLLREHEPAMIEVMIKKRMTGKQMKREEMMVACCGDISGKVRGKAFPLAQFEKRLRRGVGWTPTNVQITCFDAIADSPFGSLGDLVLIPDPETRVSIETDEDGPNENFVLGNIRYTDGRPWEFCTRSILQAALERLKKVAGVTLYGAFEHEFQIKQLTGEIGKAFTLAGFQEERHFCEAVIAAMRDAGVTPDTILKEFGSGQFEVTMAPQKGVTIADHSLITREIVGAVARELGLDPTFTPIRDPAGVGNGVHVHLSMLDDAGNPQTYDPHGKHELSTVAGQFVAGILKYLDSIVAITAPSVVSYLRLTPHRWSAAFNNLGYRDREASVRICPVSDISDIARAAQFNFEFRAADAAANPHLALAAIVHAGVQGIEEGLAVPDATQEDLSLLDADTLAERGYVRLPQTLEDALKRFEANPTVCSWFPEGFADVYVKHKRGEIAYLKDMTQAEICAAYESVY